MWLLYYNWYITQSQNDMNSNEIMINFKSVEAYSNAYTVIYYLSKCQIWNNDYLIVINHTTKIILYLLIMA